MYHICLVKPGEKIQELTFRELKHAIEKKIFDLIFNKKKTLLDRVPKSFMTFLRRLIIL